MTDERSQDIGTRLKQARAARGLTLADIACTTKISMVALRAIERNDFGQLPGGIFTRAYIRAFAEEVGLDAAIANEYHPPETVAQAVASDTSQASATGDQPQIRRFASAAVSVAVLAAAALYWINGDVRPPQSLPFPDAATTAMPLDTLLPEVTPAAASHAPLEPPAALRLEIRTTGPCWVEATAGGRTAVFRLMQPGERAVLDADASILLRVGAPEFFEYAINGMPGRQLGPPGKPVTIRMTLESYTTLLADGL